ncbi:MAG TPA: class I tRNA ligase family protein, partial [Nitrospira sp.]|nr:class I tRNA ligase family protein [Nitrospira sp.]
NFCSVDLSAVYLDILKDRLYTFRKDSPVRRGSQTVLFDILVALTKLMAPVLSFTAEEIWRMLPEAVRVDSKAESVHMAMFPEVDPRWADAELAARWDQLLEVRTAVQAALEVKRRDKVIGAPLEARVMIEANAERYEFLARYQQDLSSFFIVSDVVLTRASSPEAPSGFAITVEKATGTKCERCWNYRSAVGSSTEHPTLCDRCIEAVR